MYDTIRHKRFVKSLMKLNPNFFSGVESLSGTAWKVEPDGNSLLLEEKLLQALRYI